MNWVSSFVKDTIERLRSIIDGYVLASISGGVDSTTAAFLAKKALGDRVKAVIIDTGYLRLDEPYMVKKILDKYLPIEIYDFKEEFYKETFNISNSEVKRIKFREVFYRVLSRIARELNCEYLIQGTIAPDWIETTGGIKTQHNVLEDIGIDPLKRFGIRIIEPLRELYKSEVREIAKYLGVPDVIIYRQPFPGPGLLVRVIGRVDLDKLKVLKVATKILEDKLKDKGYSQYFIALAPKPQVQLWDVEFNVTLEEFSVKATGVKGDIRCYSKMYAVREGIDRALSLWRHIVWKYNASRVLGLLKENTGKYSMLIRVVQTKDFMTASVPLINNSILKSLIDDLSTIDDVGAIYYEVTPKPPATIEYE